MGFGLTKPEMERILAELSEDMDREIVRIGKTSASLDEKNRQAIAMFTGQIGRLSLRLLIENNARWEQALKEAGVLR